MASATIFTKPKYAIKGIQVPSEGPVPTRQEITDWWNRTDNDVQKSLFIRALQKLQEIGPSKTISYFQLAGIHCYPLAPWDGDPKGPAPGERDDFGGYCTHNMTTFPLWHRPYMALFEQALHEIMQNEIVSSIKDKVQREQWSNAADTWRLPYWDWARFPSRLPVVCTLVHVEVVSLTDPHGKKDSLPNPLLKFSNHDDSGKQCAMGSDDMPEWLRVKDNDQDKSNPLPWSRCIGTSRYGIEDGVDWPPGINNNDRADTALTNAKPRPATSLTDAVGRMLTIGYLPIYHEFASTKYHPQDPKTGKYANKNFLSLEEIHNQVHDLTGGGSMKKGGLGHMSDVPVAAFDPVFWLHHCNIDRLFGFWRKLNPNSGYTRGPDTEHPDPLFTDALPPFHYGPKPEENHTSETNWEHLRYHYEYDDLALYKDKPIEDFVNYVKQIYPTSSSTVKATPLQITRQGTRHYDDYLINVIYDRYALDGLAYSILFFLGDPPSPLSGYSDSPTYLGKVYTFSAPLLSDGVSACDNCAQQKKDSVKSTAQVPITLPLIEIIQDELNHTIPTNTEWSPRILENILKKLKIKFLDINGQERSSSEFPNTTYAVLRGTAAIEEPSGRFPTFQHYKVLGNVTDHEILGYSPEPYSAAPESSALDRLIHDDDD